MSQHLATVRTGPVSSSEPVVDSPDRDLTAQRNMAHRRPLQHRKELPPPVRHGLTIGVDPVVVVGVDVEAEIVVIFVVVGCVAGRGLAEHRPDGEG